MKNNILDKIKMQTAKLPVARFNMSNDVSYTTQFGVVNLTHCRYMHAGTKKVVNDERLHYLAPLVVPTFSRLKEKLYHHFVALTDLLPKSGLSRLVQEPFAAPSRGAVIKTPYFPRCDLGLLSCFALTGSRLTIWYGDKYSSASAQSGLTEPADDIYYTPVAKALMTSPNNNTEMYAALLDYNNKFFANNGTVGTTYTVLSKTSNNETASWANAAGNAFGCEPIPDTLLLNPLALFGLPALPVGKFLIPLGQQTFDSIAVDSSHDGSVASAVGEDPTYYNMESSDVVIPFTFDYQYSGSWRRRRIYLCFHLSDYGKRFKSFLEGAGYQLVFSGYHEVSLLPLFAAYKAYYDLFAINLYENFENSDLGYVLNCIDSGAFSTSNELMHTDFSTCGSVGATARLIAKFGDMFYTEEVDYISSHTSNNAVSNGLNPNIIHCDIDNTGAHISSPDSTGAGSTTSMQSNPNNGHSFIDNVVHGQLDSEFLMKAYRWVNRNTIAGQRIAELLRAQGLGDYVDTCKSNFIGYDETPLIINDVISSSDTYQAASGDGAQLGQRGAKGIGYNDGKKVFEFEANEIGFWITLSVIVPSAGYCQGIDPVNAGLTHKDKFYQPDFDALGMQETPMSAIVTSTKALLVNDNPSGGQGFGFTPQESHFKVARNKLLGLFSCPSEQDNYLPYVLDRIIPLNKLRQLAPASTGTSAGGAEIPSCRVINPLNIQKVPTAGVAWRYIGKYLYLENFNRMFSYKGVSANALNVFSIGYNWSELVIRDADNFIIHMIDNDQTYAHMKPIEESYETDDDGKFNTAVAKA